MRMPRLGAVDRLTWVLVAAVSVLTVAALGTAVLTRPPSGDLRTPEGVVIAFVEAIQARHADDAWALLAPSAQSPSPPVGGPVFTQDEYRRAVESTGAGSSRIRISSVSQVGNAATVQLEVTTGAGSLFGGASSHTVTVALARNPAATGSPSSPAWLITSDPSPWQFQ
ncbi:MAG TPA: hypothetical protein VET65_07710 [Candidatus Limnocylindrales bacterium]|nr:hypothetical protein [Candidatus Limnocylindrales bacterium]